MVRIGASDRVSGSDSSIWMHECDNENPVFSFAGEQSSRL